MKLAMKGTSFQADPHFTPEDDWKLWPCSREAWAQYMLMPRSLADCIHVQGRLLQAGQLFSQEPLTFDMLYSAQGTSTLLCSTHDCRYIACQWTALPCQSMLQGSAANEAQPFPHPE